MSIPSAQGLLRMRTRPVFLLAAAAFSLFACTERRTDMNREVDTDEPLTVKVVPATFSKVSPELSSFGSLSFITKVDISPPVEGTIKAMHAEEGDKVTKGKLLAEIENTQLEIRASQAETSLAQAEASLSLADANYREGLLQVEARFISIEKLELTLAQQKLEIEDMEKDLAGKEELLSMDGVTEDQVKNLRLSLKAGRTEYENTEKDIAIKRIGLRDEDIRSTGHAVPYDPARKLALLKEISCLTLQAEREVARAGLTAAEQELRSVNLLLDELKVASPATGILGARYLEEGERLSVGTKLFTVMRGDRLHVVFPVREQDALLVREGQEVAVSLPALGGEERTAKVTLISPMFDPQSGNITVKAELDNRDLTLKPGMFARVRLIHGKPAAKMLLPLSALFTREGETGELFTAAGGRAFKRTARLGTESGGRVEILSGVDEGELVVDAPPPMLKDGDNVRVK